MQMAGTLQYGYASSIRLSLSSARLFTVRKCISILCWFKSITFCRYADSADTYQTRGSKPSGTLKRNLTIVRVIDDLIWLQNFDNHNISEHFKRGNYLEEEKKNKKNWREICLTINIQTCCFCFVFVFYKKSLIFLSCCKYVFHSLICFLLWTLATKERERE